MTSRACFADMIRPLLGAHLAGSQPAPIAGRPTNRYQPMNLIEYPRSLRLLPPPRYVPTQPAILVVDDEPSLLSLLRRILLHRSVVIETASTGREALAAMAARQFDLVITDYNMPGMTGLQLARELRDGYGAPPVILISGELSPDVVEHPDWYCLAGTVAKPFTAPALLAALDRVLPPSPGQSMDSFHGCVAPQVTAIDARPLRNWGINE